MADYTKARSEAQRVLSDLGISRPPIDPEEISEKLGVDVVFADFNVEISKDISGYIEFPKDQDARIVINAATSPARQNFTIAHELGHFLMHQDYARGNNYRVMPRYNSHGVDKPDEEREADAFAAHLLAPQGLVKKYEPVTSLSELAKIFLVSEEMMRNRLNNIARFGH